MAASENEDEKLRATALKNVESILTARQHAERELVEARDALRARTTELDQQREWFEVALASIGDAVITTDTRGAVTFLNPVAEIMTGWPTSEAKGQPLEIPFRIVNEDTGETAENPVEKVLQTGRVVGLANHTALISRNGVQVAIEDSAAPIRDPQGSIVGAVMVFHDVTRRRAAERALRESEQRLRAVFTQAAVGIGITDLQGRFAETNRRFCDILGYAPEELSERTFLELTHPDDVAATQKQVRRLLAGEIGNYSLEKRYVRKDGTFVWSATTVTLLRRESGEASQFIGIIDDITARKRAEELQLRLAAVVECSDDAILTKTLDGIITTWNRGAQQMFGYTAQEMVGRPVTVLIPPDHIDEEPAILERLRRGERIEHYETVRRTKDGALLHISLSVSPLMDSRGKIIGASKIARDITRQKQAELALRDEIESRERAEAALRETDRRKDEFLATLAHELRNPLAPIRQAALIAKMPAATEPQKRWSHDVISRQVQHMSLLLDDLLDISRVTRGTLELRMEMTELAEVIEVAVETARPLIEAKRHHFTIDVPEEPIVFAADPLRVAQVLANLLTNAAKYTDPEGHIRLRASSDAEHVTISVTDTGIGIAPEALPRVFVMFSQVKTAQDRSEGGLGIGLALSKGLVDLHGGTLHVLSKGPDRGSEFVVRLPHRTITPAGKASAPPPPHQAKVPRRVLIADDNWDAAESLAILLRMEGHDVTVVHDGLEAVKAFDALLPEVALLDIGMPDLNGYEVARQVRQRSLGRAVTLIAVTGWGQQSDKARALAAGFNHHFTKPIEPERVLELLQAAPRARP